MPRKPTFNYDLIVIGSGAAGSTAAIAAANAEKRVAIVEAHEFGGESPNWGDIPLKSLLHASNLYQEAREGVKFGLRSSSLGYNFPTMLKWKDIAIQRTGAGGNRSFYDSRGIDTYHGRAHFISSHEISVGRKRLSAAHFIVATGTHYAQPDFYGAETITLQTPQTILQQPRLPKSVFVIGASNSGVELTQLLSSLGAKVYLSDASVRLLPEEDQEVSDALESILHAKKGVTCLTQAQVLSTEKKGLGVRVTYIRGGTEHSVTVDEVICTTERRASVDMGLENAHISYTPQGIEVDANLRTSTKHIFAAGSVLGDETPTHIALLQGRAAAYNVINKTPIAPDYQAAPRVLFTYPGVASVGLRENDCIKRDLRIKQAIAPLSMIPRSNTSDFHNGFVKIISDQKGVILGATIVAPEAGEMIHELGLAVKHKLTVQQVAETPHAFLSWSEAIRVAANKLSQ